MATVLVVGGQGCLGTIVARELSRRGWNVIRGGRRPDGSEDLRLIDLDDPSTWDAALADVDIIISTVPHPALPLERHILETGGFLLSPATISRSSLLRLAASRRPARGTVIPHAGLTPGLGHLLAAELLQTHPQASKLTIGMTFPTHVAGKDGIRWTFGHYMARERKNARRVPLPAPLDGRICSVRSLAQEGWLDDEDWPTLQQFEFCLVSRSIDLFLRGLARLHLLPSFGRVYAPTFGKGRFVATEEQIFHWISVREPSGLEQGRLIDARGDYRSTAISVGIFAEFFWPRVAAAEVGPGVLRIQDALRFDDVKGAFEDRGIKVRSWNPG